MILKVMNLIHIFFGFISSAYTYSLFNFLATSHLIRVTESTSDTNFTLPQV